MLYSGNKVVRWASDTLLATSLKDSSQTNNGELHSQLLTSAGQIPPSPAEAKHTPKFTQLHQCLRNTQMLGILGLVDGWILEVTDCAEEREMDFPLLHPLTQALTYWLCWDRWYFASNTLPGQYLLTKTSNFHHIWQVYSDISWPHTDRPRAERTILIPLISSGNVGRISTTCKLCTGLHRLDVTLHQQYL